MLDGEPEAGRRAVIEDIDGIAIEADDLGEAVDRLRDPVEGVAAVRHVGLAEARQIGSDDVEAVGQQRDEIAEHVAGAREPVQQQQLRGAGRAGLAIEDVEAVHVGGSIFDGGHVIFPSSVRSTSLFHRPFAASSRSSSGHRRHQERREGVNHAPRPSCRPPGWPP